jgi:hypothetical protein
MMNKKKRSLKMDSKQELNQNNDNLSNEMDSGNKNKRSKKRKHVKNLPSSDPIEYRKQQLLAKKKCFKSIGKAYSNDLRARVSKLLRPEPESGTDLQLVLNVEGVISTRPINVDSLDVVSQVMQDDELESKYQSLEPNSIINMLDNDEKQEQDSELGAISMKGDSGNNKTVDKVEKPMSMTKIAKQMMIHRCTVHRWRTRARQCESQADVFFPEAKPQGGFRESVAVIKRFQLEKLREILIQHPKMTLRELRTRAIRQGIFLLTPLVFSDQKDDQKEDQKEDQKKDQKDEKSNNPKATTAENIELTHHRRIPSIPTLFRALKKAGFVHGRASYVDPSVVEGRKKHSKQKSMVSSPLSFAMVTR